MKYPAKWMIGIIFVLTTGLACSAPGFGQPAENGNQPSVAISSPTEGQSVEANQKLQVQSVSIDPQGVVRVELVVDGDVVWVDANAQPEANSPFIVSQPWTPKLPGTHTIQVRAFNKDNITGESETLTLAVAAPAAAINSQTDSGGAGSAGSSSDTLKSKETPPPEPTKTPPPTPTATPKATGTPEASTTPAITTTITATPAPQKFEPTGIEPVVPFKQFWDEVGAGESRLGHPVDFVIFERNYARQLFQKGAMIWWDNPDNPDYIWVIDSAAEDMESGKTSNLYPDTWVPDPTALDEYSCNEARDEGPVRGFGKVWCEHPELQRRLGFPVLAETGSGGIAPFSQVQFFQGGTMLYLPHSAEVFILYEQGDWQRFLY